MVIVGVLVPFNTWHYEGLLPDIYNAAESWYSLRICQTAVCVEYVQGFPERMAPVVLFATYGCKRVLDCWGLRRMASAFQDKVIGSTSQCIHTQIQFTSNKQKNLQFSNLNVWREPMIPTGRDLIMLVSKLVLARTRVPSSVDTKPSRNFSRSQ